MTILVTQQSTQRPTMALSSMFRHRQLTIYLSFLHILSEQIRQFPHFGKSAEMLFDTFFALRPIKTRLRVHFDKPLPPFIFTKLMQCSLKHEDTFPTTNVTPPLESVHACAASARTNIISPIHTIINRMGALLLLSTLGTYGLPNRALEIVMGTLLLLSTLGAYGLPNRALEIVMGTLPLLSTLGTHDLPNYTPNFTFRVVTSRNSLEPFQFPFRLHSTTPQLLPLTPYTGRNGSKTCIVNLLPIFNYHTRHHTYHCSYHRSYQFTHFSNSSCQSICARFVQKSCGCTSHMGHSALPISAYSLHYLQPFVKYRGSSSHTPLRAT